jgi:hypothetical protein
MSSRKHRWLSALLVLFMVFIIPGCWYGALERASATQSAPNSNNNNNEEREEHDGENEAAPRAAHGRSPRPRPVALVSISRPTPILAQRAILASQAHAPEPSRFSERRLI